MLEKIISKDSAVLLPLTATLLALITSFISLSLTRLRTQNQYEKELREMAEKVFKSKTKVNNQSEDSETNKTNDSFENSTNTDSSIKTQYIIKTKEEIELALHENMMRAHQKQALMHSRVQFYTGILMSVFGFVFFIYIIYLSIDSNNNLGIGIKLTSSLIFEAIAIIFLKESHKLRESAKEYHDSLSESKKQQESILITENIEDKSIQSIVQAQLSLHLIGIKSETIDITKILEAQNKKEN